MRLTPPSSFVFFLSLLAGGAGIAARMGYLPMAALFSFLLVATGFSLLILSVAVRGL